MTADAAGTDAARLSIWVQGHVQGVGFRWWVRERATTSGLRGLASNLPDGSVEIVLEGSRTDCVALLAQIQGGGTPGRVASVTSRWGSPSGLTSFTLS
ncbi:MAG: acylphosphatase [Actinomycetota bacterium]|nr:acylphosphatase [Actinomycetota bacterium]